MSDHHDHDPKIEIWISRFRFVLGFNKFGLMFRFRDIESNRIEAKRSEVEVELFCLDE